MFHHKFDICQEKDFEFDKLCCELSLVFYIVQDLIFQDNLRFLSRRLIGMTVEDFL